MSESFIDNKQVSRPKVACQILGVSSSTLNRMVLNGFIKPPIKISKRAVAYRTVELFEYLEKRTLERDNDQ